MPLLLRKPSCSSHNFSPTILNLVSISRSYPSQKAPLLKPRPKILRLSQHLPLLPMPHAPTQRHILLAIKATLARIIILLLPSFPFLPLPPLFIQTLPLTFSLYSLILLAFSSSSLLSSFPAFAFAPPPPREEVATSARPSTSSSSLARFCSGVSVQMALIPDFSLGAFAPFPL